MVAVVVMGIVFLGCEVFCAVRVAIVYGGRSAPAVWLVMVGAIAGVAAVALMRLQARRRSVRRVIGVGTGLIYIGVLVAVLPPSHGATTYWQPLWLQALGLGAALIVLGYALFFFIRAVASPERRAAARSRRRPQPPPSGEHLVAVYDTRPMPGDKNQFEPYYVAICDCGWLGRTHDTSPPAFEDAHNHSVNVESTMRRPVG